MLLRFSILLIALSITACFTPRVRHQFEQKRHAEVTADPVSREEPANAVAAAATTANDAATAPAAVAKAEATTFSGTAPEKALGWLKNGNKRFVKGWFRKDGKAAKDLKRMISSNTPHTVVLSCSDARVTPEHIFDQALGEIQTIRVAGQALDASVLASLEQSVLESNTRHILVMGHTHCDAISTTIESPRKPAASTNIGHLVADIGPRVQNASSPTSSELYVESFNNAKGVASDMLARSEILRTLVAKGQVKVTTAVYNLKSGIVDFAN